MYRPPGHRAILSGVRMDRIHTTRELHPRRPHDPFSLPRRPPTAQNSSPTPPQQPAQLEPSLKPRPAGDEMTLRGPPRSSNLASPNKEPRQPPVRAQMHRRLPIQPSSSRFLPRQRSSSPSAAASRARCSLLGPRRHAFSASLAEVLLPVPPPRHRSYSLTSGPTADRYL